MQVHKGDKHVLYIFMYISRMAWDWWFLKAFSDFNESSSHHGADNLKDTGSLAGQWAMLQGEKKIFVMRKNKIWPLNVLNYSIPILSAQNGYSILYNNVLKW